MLSGGDTANIAFCRSLAEPALAAAWGEFVMHRQHRPGSACKCLLCLASRVNGFFSGRGGLAMVLMTLQLHFCQYCIIQDPAHALATILFL